MGMVERLGGGPSGIGTRKKRVQEKSAWRGYLPRAKFVRSKPLGKHDKYLRRHTFLSRNIGISLAEAHFALGEALMADNLGNG